VAVEWERIGRGWKGYDIIAFHFNYGQRTEKRELEAFRKIAKYLNP